MTCIFRFSARKWRVPGVPGTRKPRDYRGSSLIRNPPPPPLGPPYDPRYSPTVGSPGEAILIEVPLKVRELSEGERRDVVNGVKQLTRDN